MDRNHKEALKDRFNPKNEWQKLSINLQPNKEYEISVELSENWADDGIKADLSGWLEYKFLANIYSTLRRTKDFGFYQLGFCYSKDYKNCTVLDKPKNIIKVKSNTVLYLFVNDVANFAFNNDGYANISFTSID